MTRLFPAEALPDGYRIVLTHELNWTRMRLQRRSPIPFLWTTLDTAVVHSDDADSTWIQKVTDRMALAARTDA